MLRCRCKVGICIAAKSIVSVVAKLIIHKQFCRVPYWLLLNCSIITPPVRFWRWNGSQVLNILLQWIFFSNDLLTIKHYTCLIFCYLFDTCLIFWFGIYILPERFFVGNTDVLWTCKHDNYLFRIHASYFAWITSGKIYMILNFVICLDRHFKLTNSILLSSLSRHNK